MSLAELRERIPNATPGELELVAHYATLPEDARRERAFLAFAATGLPHRRMEAWKWSDFKQALKTLDPPESAPGTDPFEDLDGPVIRVTGERITFPDTLQFQRFVGGNPAANDEKNAVFVHDGPDRQRETSVVSLILAHAAMVKPPGARRPMALHLAD